MLNLVSFGVARLPDVSRPVVVRFRAGEFSSPIRFVNRQALFFSPDPIAPDSLRFGSCLARRVSRIAIGVAGSED